MLTTSATLPGEDRNFPATAWTVLLTARDPGAPGMMQARETLCQIYWPPVARYLQALGLGREDAEDGAQEILSGLFDEGALLKLDPARGRLRHYLKAAARHLSHNLHRHRAAKKRGGGEAELNFEDLENDAALSQAGVSDEAFDREWAWTLCERAMAELEASYVRRNKTEVLAALKPMLISTGEMQRYETIGSLLGVGVPQIRIEVHRMRRLLGELLRREVATTMGTQATKAEIEEEMRYLVKTLAHEPSH